MGKLPAPAVREDMPAAEFSEPGVLYVERIKPLLDETGATVDEIMKRVAEGPASAAEVAFVRDYARYAIRIAERSAWLDLPVSSTARHYPRGLQLPRTGLTVATACESRLFATCEKPPLTRISWKRSIVRMTQTRSRLR